MLKYLILFLVISNKATAQTAPESLPLLGFAKQVTGMNVAYVSWTRENDTIYIRHLRIWDRKPDLRERAYRGEELKANYPQLYRLHVRQLAAMLKSEYLDLDSLGPSMD